MGIFDKLLGRQPQQPAPAPAEPTGYVNSAPPTPQQGFQNVPQTANLEDKQAIERYQYLLKTAPPDQIEQAHKEAFEKLTPAQRKQVLEQLTHAGAQPANDSPDALARSATRMEVQQPGSLERTLGPQSAGGGMMGGGGMGLGGTLLASVAGGVIGSGIGHMLFSGGGMGGMFGGGHMGGDTIINNTTIVNEAPVDGGGYDPTLDGPIDSGGDFFGDFGGGFGDSEW